MGFRFFNKPSETKKGEGEPLIKRIFQSIFRHTFSNSLANRLAAVSSNLFLHIHPARIPRYALQYRFTLCAGGLSFFFFLLLIASGISLLFHYRPTPENAYNDVAWLIQRGGLLGILRHVHRLAGDAMVAMVFIHLLRVLFTGSYRPPREFNWIIGVGLLLLTVALNFSGYVLIWDERAFYAGTVANELVKALPFLGANGPFSLFPEGGDLSALLFGQKNSPGDLLHRFYLYHVMLLPLVVALLSGLHFWRVRKDGLSGPL